MRRSRSGRWLMRGERGSSSVEMVIALPIVLTVLFLAVQAGTWFHARSIALASAESGARTSAMLNSSLEAGLSSARSFAADVGGTTLTGVTVTGDRTATSTTVTVTGHSVRLVPFMGVTVSQSAKLVPVEKTVMTEGQAATPTLLAIDQALRLLAVSREDRDAPPPLLAVQLLPGEVAVQLVEPVTLAHPWRPDPADDRRWLLATGAQEREPTARSAYPQLVSVGLDDDGATWLVNLEQLGTISLTGDPTYAADFARYVATEIAVNPWARQVQLDCVGIAPEAVPLDPARIRHHRLEDPTALEAAIAAARVTVDKCADHDVTAAAGRIDDLGGDVWDSWLVLVNGALSSSPLNQLLALVGEHPARTGTAVVMVADNEPIRGLGVRLTGQGRVLIPSLGLDLIANGLTPAEAEGCALLLAHADLLDDVEMPSDGDDGWREYVDAAGAIRDELVLPRDTDPEAEPGATVVPAPDAEVLDVAATTKDDLQQLAPHVPDKVRVAVERSDAGLDADLAAWATGARPHLRLLGPIQARTGTTGKPTAVAKRKAFYTELLAFLALHPLGVTIDQVVDAFGSDATQMRVHLFKVRSWLGVDPTTGGNYLPDATKSPAGVARGMGIYQLVGVLADIDLFRRLRARGQARGSEGLSDLQAALGLVTGEPFTGQRGGRVVDLRGVGALRHSDRDPNASG